MRPLFGPRTVVEAAFLVAVPVGMLEVGLSWYAILAAGAAAYLLVLAVEAEIWRRGRKKERREPPRPAPVPPRPEPIPPPPPPEPAPPLPEPEPELPPAAAAAAPRQWNVRDLEQVAREHSGGDPVADEERTFLLRYLHDFAGPDGLLPVDFDELVRQSFGALVANR